MTVSPYSLANFGDKALYQRTVAVTHENLVFYNCVITMDASMMDENLDEVLNSVANNHLANEGVPYYVTTVSVRENLVNQL